MTTKRPLKVASGDKDPKFYEEDKWPYYDEEQIHQRWAARTEQATKLHPKNGQ